MPANDVPTPVTPNGDAATAHAPSPVPAPIADAQTSPPAPTPATAPGANVPAAQKAASAPTVAATAVKTVLIVEDEKPLAHALEMKLKNEGFIAKTVMNGEDALSELSNNTYDFVLLDLIMPKLDGFAVLQELKNRGKHVAVIVLSNLGQEEDRAKAKELGAINYFVKSNTPIAQIVASVKSALA